MHIRPVTKAYPPRANLRDTLEVLLLFLDVVSAVIGIFRKEHDHDHDDDHGHVH